MEEAKEKIGRDTALYGLITGPFTLASHLRGQEFFIVCPLVSQISPKHFNQLLFESYKEIFDYIRSKGALSSFFLCGNATPNIESMCKTNPYSVSVDKNVDLASAKEITDRHDIVIGGNIPLTTVMLYGTQQDNMKYIVDLL
jgi:uroporphyrinogen decarboxylase